MKVKTMIETALATLEEQDRPRMAAAMYLGARFALESVISDNPYSTSGDVKKILADLDGIKAPAPTISPAEEPPIAPVVEELAPSF